MKKLIKSLSLLVLLILATGCETGKNLQTPSSEPKIDPNIAVVDVKTFKMIQDIKAVSLEWVGSSKENINGYHIYRKDLDKTDSRFVRVGTVEDKYAKHFVDDNLEPNSQYAYCISTIGENNFESNPSDARAIRTYPLFESVAFIDASSNLPRKVRVQWRPHELISIKEYILEKSTPTEAEWKQLTKVNNRLNVEFIDKDLKDNATYNYRIKAVSFDGIESLPSDIATATTKALPLAIGGLEATQNEPQKIILKWSPTTQKDAIAYNIYVSNDAEKGFKLIHKASLSDNTFEHSITENDKTNYYKITTLDKDALETDIKLLAPTMGKTLSAPLQPTITLAQINTSGVILNWTKGDERAVSYNVYKKVRESFFRSSETMIKDTKALRVEDPEVIRGIDYSYEIEAVDKFGLVSKRTKPATLTMPKLIEQKPEPKQTQSQN